MPEQSLVLDTHIWIWTVTADASIKITTRQKIHRALVANRVLVPAICIWEAALLWKKNRIQLHEPVVNWAQSSLLKSGFMVAPLTEAIALESALLPGKFHNDPADCMILATARLENALLLTRDRRMLEYAEAGHVNVLCV